MRFGVCAPISEAALLSEIGFDYVEVNASALAAMDDAAFEAFCKENAAAPLHAEAANCLFPGDLALVGNAVQEEAVNAYIERVMCRLGQAGVKIAVFGSGGARRVPEGFSPALAFEQLVGVAQKLGAAAKQNGVTVALEPLRSAETNILNTQLEGLQLVRAASHPGFRLLCDYYHLVEEGGAMADVVACGDTLVHTHIANPDGRVALRMGDRADYAQFFAALRDAGYTGRMSLECNEDGEEAWRAALSVLRAQNFA